jgi:hypothetical protein
VDRPADPFPPICATGLRTTAEVVEAPPGRCRVLGVRLAPPAAFGLLGAALPELTSLTVDLHDLLGRGAVELATQVHGARDGASAVRAAAAWAARRMLRAGYRRYRAARARGDRRRRRNALDRRARCLARPPVPICARCAILKRPASSKAGSNFSKTRHPDFR